MTRNRGSIRSNPVLRGRWRNRSHRRSRIHTLVRSNRHNRTSGRSHRLVRNKVRSHTLVHSTSRSRTRARNNNSCRSTRRTDPCMGRSVDRSRSSSPTSDRRIAAHRSSRRNRTSARNSNPARSRN